MTSIADTSRPARAPPGVPLRRPGPALAALSVTSFSIGVGEFSPMGLLPEMAADLGVSIPAAGLLVTAYALGVVVGAPILAILTARLERRRTLLWLAAIFVAGNLLCALSPNYTLLFAARIFTALAHGTFFGIGAVLAADIAAPGRQTQAISLMFVGMTLASVFGVPIGALVGQAFGWRATFWLVFAASLLAALALARFLPVSHPGAALRVRDEIGALARPQVLLAMAASVVASTVLFLVYTYISPLLQIEAGLASERVPLMLLVFGAGLTVGNLAGGWLADRRMMAAIVGLFASLSLILVAIHFALAATVALTVLVFLWGFVAFGLVAPLQMRIVREAKGARNLASTVNQSAFNLGNALGAFLGAGLVGAGAAYATLPLAGAAIALLGLAIALVSAALDRAVRP